jgi:hypothetical protein
LKCEGAVIAGGAASASTPGTAACITVANPSAINKMPADVAALKNEVIVQKAYR